MHSNRYILWDFDGTLAQRSGGWTGALLELLHTENLDKNITRDTLRPFLITGFRWHNPEVRHPPNTPADAWWGELQPTFERAFREGAGLPSDQARRLAQKVRQVLPDPTRWRLFPDTQETLATLAHLGWKHILLTNHMPELPLILDALGLRGRFVSIFNSAETGVEKPNRAAFDNVLSSLPSTARVWMVGDNPVADIQGAEAVGIPAILVRKSHASVQRYAAELSAIAGIVESDGSSV